MHSQHFIGCPGVPAVLTGMGALEVRHCLQPQNDREEYLLALLEETGAKLADALILQDDFDEDDDLDTMRDKVDLRVRCSRAEDETRRCRERMWKVTQLAKDALMTQAMIASPEARTQALLDALAKFGDWLRN